MEAIVLKYRGEVLRVFELGGTGLEVGSGPGCDIVVHDSDVPERLFWIGKSGVDVVIYDLRAGEKTRAVVMRAGKEIDVGERHSIARITEATSRGARSSPTTEQIAVEHAGEISMSLLFGAGVDARRVSLGGRPLLLGSDDECDVVISDRAVSARHARIEPAHDGLILRDLRSRNGTYVDGVPAYVARIGPGSRIRIGRTDLQVVARGVSGDARSSGLVAASPQMIELLGQVERFAQVAFTALVVGESGSGKEGIARALHTRGPRRSQPLVTLNGAAIARDLVESELFGHEKGAFTGALGTRRGVFEQADRGTLFLDEVGELPLAVQARLLRVLETREVRRVGGEQSIPVDVRLVCATHRDLRQMVARGEFREDLYYRLAQLRLVVPPLRDRAEDIVPLARHFLAGTVRAEIGPRELTERGAQALLAHSWPGNVRELRNVIQSAALISNGLIDRGDVESAIEQFSTRDPRALIDHAVARYDGNLSAAARALGMPRTTLRDRVRTKGKRGRDPDA